MIDFLSRHGAEMWSLVAAVFTVSMSNLLRLRPKLRYSHTHSSNLPVNEPLRHEGREIATKQLLRVASITVSNVGLQSAKGVELSFAFKPQIFHVRPMRRFDEATSGAGQFTLSFSSLAPGEIILVDIVALNGELPVLTAVRAEECVGKEITMQPQPIAPSWINRSLQGLLLLGLATLIYMAVSLVQRVNLLAHPSSVQATTVSGRR